jgi:hypothetical protein
VDLSSDGGVGEGLSRRRRGHESRGGGGGGGGGLGVGVRLMELRIHICVGLCGVRHSVGWRVERSSGHRRREVGAGLVGGLVELWEGVILLMECGVIAKGRLTDEEGFDEVGVLDGPSFLTRIAIRVALEEGLDE